MEAHLLLLNVRAISSLTIAGPLLIEIEENLQKAQNALALMERKNEALQDELRDCREQLRETSGDDAEQQRLATDLEVALNRISTRPSSIPHRICSSDGSQYTISHRFRCTEKRM